MILQTLVNKFYKPEYKKMQLLELLKVAKTIDFQMSEDDVKRVEEATRDQCNSWMWEKHRVGRVTGSSFKLVCQTTIQKPAKSTIMKICYPEITRFESKATTYGKEMEPVALKMFIESTNAHSNFSCSRPGLTIDPLCNFFAVSPDAISKCDCCDNRIVEIKCPFSLASADATIQNLLTFKDPYILFENGSYKMNKDHLYFYQLQIQMAVCRVKVSYFYVWSPQLQIAFEVPFEPKFWQEKSVKAFRFANMVIVPELMNSYYTKTYACAG